MKTLKILAVGDPAVYGYVKKEFEIISNYEQKNKIKIIFDIVEWNDYYNTLLQSFMKYTYDVVMVAGHLWLTDFVNKGFLKELKVDEDFNDFLEVIQEEMTLNNRKYLLPSFCDGHMLAIRKDQVKLNTSKNISIKDTISLINVGETCLKAHPSEIFLDVVPYLRAYNVEPFNAKGEIDFDVKQAVKALRHYKNMVKLSVPNTLEFGNGEVLDHIQKNKVKLGVSWGGQIGQIMNNECINPETLEFVGLKESWNVTWSFGIPRQTTKYKEALQFIKYLTSPSVDRLIGGFSGNPTRTSTFETDQNKYPWYPNLKSMLESAKPLPNLPNTGDLIGIYTEELVKFVNGEQNETTTIDNIITNIQK